MKIKNRNILMLETGMLYLHKSISMLKINENQDFLKTHLTYYYTKNVKIKYQK